MAATYGYRFPNGKVVPEDDVWALTEAIRDDPNYVRILSDDEYSRGYWYADAYRDALRMDVEGMDEREFRDRYGVRTVVPKGRGAVRYVLPDGERVDVRGLYDWLETEGYPFEEWFRYERYGDWFKEMARDYAETLAFYHDPSEMGHYGYERVRLDSPSRRPRAGNKMVSETIRTKSWTSARKPSKKSPSKSKKNGARRCHTVL